MSVIMTIVGIAVLATLIISSINDDKRNAESRRNFVNCLDEIQRKEGR